MSIPGLGQIPTQPPPGSRTRTITLQPLWEWRFESSHQSFSTLSSSGTTSVSTALTIRLVSGTAERDGTELALNVPYTLPGTKSKILTWQGCTLEVSGECEDYVAEYTPADEPAHVSYLNLHHVLQSRRRQRPGAGAWAPPTTHPPPRVLVCGGTCSGKSTLTRTLAALATRQGSQPCLVNLDPGEGLLSLPGTLSAAVFGGVMDAEAPEGGTGVGASPSSGPGLVPVKLPIVHYYGRDRVEEEPDVWKAMVGRLGRTVNSRLTEDEASHDAGLIVDMPDVSGGENGVDLLAYAVEMFAVNIVVVLGSAHLHTELQPRLAQTKTKHGEQVTVLLLDKSQGAVERGEGFMQQVREVVIKEYFFGDARRTLSPFTLQVDFADVTIYKIPEPSDYMADEEELERIDPVPEMAHWTLALVNSPGSIEEMRRGPIRGFVYVAEVDTERKRLKILSPVSGRLGDQPLVWGRWPEPYINLLG